MKLRLLLIAGLMACFTVAYVPNYVNSYSGETAVGILGGAVAGCALNEAYNGVKDNNSHRTTPTRDEGSRNVDKDIREFCNERYPDNDDEFWTCIRKLSN
jgi:hypothetical protein